MIKRARKKERARNNWICKCLLRALHKIQFCNPWAPLEFFYWTAETIWLVLNGAIHQHVDFQDRAFITDFLQKMIHLHQAGFSLKRLGLAVPGHQKVAKYPMFVGIAWPAISICPEDPFGCGLFAKDANKQDSNYFRTDRNIGSRNANEHWIELNCPIARKITWAGLSWEAQ